MLVFGAGTDYALLLVSRYREELRDHEDKHEAVRIAMRKAGPAIVASRLTVMAALLTLSLAEVTGTAGLGPIGALGVGLAMVSMLTILPALLAITGRRAFWPFIPRVGSEGVDETHGLWSRIAALGRPRPPPRLDRHHGPAAGAVPRADPAQQRPDRRAMGSATTSTRSRARSWSSRASRPAPTRRPTSSSPTRPSSTPVRDAVAGAPGRGCGQPGRGAGADRDEARGDARGGPAQHRGLRPGPRNPGGGPRRRRR